MGGNRKGNAVVEIRVTSTFVLYLELMNVFGSVSLRKSSAGSVTIEAIVNSTWNIQKCG